MPAPLSSSPTHPEILEDLVENGLIPRLFCTNNLNDGMSKNLFIIQCFKIKFFS